MRKEPKDKLFSVSFTASELKKLKRHVDDLQMETGYKISRNQFVRKATLAMIEYQRLVKSGDWENVSIDEIFKGIE